MAGAQRMELSRAARQAELDALTETLQRVKVDRPAVQARLVRKRALLSRRAMSSGARRMLERSIAADEAQLSGNARELRMESTALKR